MSLTLTLTTKMIYSKITKKSYCDRLTAKKALGGTKGFNEALKRGELLFINSDTIKANNELAKTINSHSPYENTK